MKTLCCGYEFKDDNCPIFWNQFNLVVQCHNCGHVWEPRTPATRPTIIAICGSTRFIELIAVTAWTFEKQGAITLAPMLLPSGYFSDSHAAEAQGVKEQIDALFLKKIELADKVFVVNKDGYIGESTRNEIAYAEKLGKPITYLEPITP